MNSYVELVRRRLEDRSANLLVNLDELPEAQLRYTMRVFGDCLDDAAHGKMFEGYSEHQNEKELREFAKTFVPAYTRHAVADLEEKKKDGERFKPPFLTREEYQEMAVREKWPLIAEHLDAVLGHALVARIHHARVVDAHVETAVRLPDRSEHRRNGRLVRHVTRDEQRALSDLGRGALTS